MRKSTIILAAGIFIIAITIIHLRLGDYTPGQMVGGQRDEHGCLGPAGYSWNESIGACVREWELDTSEKRDAAKIAVDYYGRENGLTVSEILVARCPGCFEVTLEKYAERTRINIEAWEAKGIAERVDSCVSDEECIPLPSSCHPLSCINMIYEENYIKPKVCTEIFMVSAAYNPEDCICIEGRCINRNLDKM